MRSVCTFKVKREELLWQSIMVGTESQRKKKNKILSLSNKPQGWIFVVHKVLWKKKKKLKAASGFSWVVEKKVKAKNSLSIFTSWNRKAKVKKLQGLKALTLEPWSRWPCFSSKHSLTSLLPCSLFCCALLFPLFRTLQQSTMRQVCLYLL